MSSKMKKRFIWPESLHSDFIRAIFAVGLIHCNTNMIKSFLRPGAGTADSLGLGGFSDHQIDSIIHKLRLFNAQQMSIIEQKNHQKKRSSSVTTVATTSTAMALAGGGGSGGMLDELSNMNKLINSQVELLERFRHSLMKQISIRDKLSNAIATTAPASSISTASSTISLSSSSQQRVCPEEERQQQQQTEGAGAGAAAAVKYVEEGVDLGKGLIEIRDDHSDGSSTRSVIAPASRPRVSPTPTNTSGITSVAGATRHIVMPPPSNQPSSHGSYHGFLGSDSGANTPLSYRKATSSLHSSDGGGGETGDFSAPSLSRGVDLKSYDHPCPQSHSVHHPHPTTSSDPSSCDPTTVNRHRSELYMVSAMRSHMNMHRELLQFNSQYTLPVVLPPDSSSSISTNNSHHQHHQQQQQSGHDSSLQLEAQRYFLNSPSSESLQSYDPSGDHSLTATDLQTSSNPYDLQLLSSLQQSSSDHASRPIAPSPACDDDDLDTSLFDFLF
jgi:hypothetical protein